MDAEKLSTLMKEAGYDPDARDRKQRKQAFCDSARINLTTLERYLSGHGRAHEDTLRSMADVLPVRSWKDLRFVDVEFPLTDSQRDQAPLSLTFHIRQDNSRYRHIIEAIRQLLIAFNVPCEIHIAMVKRGSVKITIWINIACLFPLLDLFDKRKLAHLPIYQIDLLPDTIEYIDLLTIDDTIHYSAIENLKRHYSNLRFRQFSNGTIAARTKPIAKQTTISLHE